MAQSPTGIELRAKVFPLAFILYLFHPTIEINGHAAPAKWGTQFFPVAPGTHQVTVYFKYMFYANCNKASTPVTVSPGQVAVVTYKTRWLVFLSGRISVEAVGAPAATAA
jgi:hypothetical protein